MFALSFKSSNRCNSAAYTILNDRTGNEATNDL
jgi:hypothetical protein